MNYLGLYVHIPFCKSKCRYCDFNSFANREDDIRSYFSALSRQAQAWAKKTQNSVVDTIYFGGGTPSYIPTEIMSGFIAELGTLFEFDSDCEITIECNPGTIGYDGFARLRESGVNRLSIGLQSTDDGALKALGRIHTVGDFEECLAAARRAGFENISLDLMYGLPDMTMELWERTLRQATAYGVQHISAYALKIEEGTPFSKMQLELPDEDLCADMYEKAVAVLRDAGYSRYEISNFALPGRESRHNLKYWRCDDFLGLGAGAYSCMRGERFCGPLDIDEYIAAVSDDGCAATDVTRIGAEEQMSEFVFLGLRCERGISFSEFEKRFSKSFDRVYGSAAKKYIDWGFLVTDGEFLRFSDKGFFVSNTILADFV